MNILTVIGLVIAVIGAIPVFWFLYEKLFKRKKLSWRFAEKTAFKIVDMMAVQNFNPDLIFGIGRGGAIMGSMISGCLGHRPLLVIDRKYTYEEGTRIDGMIQKIDIAFKISNLLIVAGEVHTGNTMRLYYDLFKELGIKKIKRATLYYEKGSTVDTEYKGIISTNKDLLMPWMFSDRYIRQDRGPEEARVLKGS